MRWMSGGALLLAALVACDGGTDDGQPGGADAADAGGGDAGGAGDTAVDAGPGDAGAGDAGGDAGGDDAGGVGDAAGDAGGGADDVALPDTGDGGGGGTDGGADGGADGGGADAEGDVATPPWLGDCTTVIEASEGGGAIQAALIAAAPGDLVCLGPGVFAVASELSLAVDGVTIRGYGMDSSVLDFSEQLVGANGLKVTADGVILEDFGIVDPAGDGVRADAVSGFTARRLSVKWTTPASGENGGYGLYPVQSHDVLVEECVAVGASDTGVYVGQSTNVLVRTNEAYGNVAGIEIENTTDAEVVDNYVHDNAGGILVFNLPDLPVQDGKRAKVHDNRIEENDGPNFALEGNIVAMVPSGTGVMVLASDDNEIHHNTIKGNQTAGVLIISYAELLFGKPTDPDFDAFPEGNWVHDNELEGNGDAPQGVAAALPVPKPMPPLAWDGCTDPEKGGGDALRNCFSANGTAGYVNFDLCGGFADVQTDIGPVTCEQQALPAITIPGEGP